MTDNTATFDVVEFVMAFEAGELDSDDVVAGFQHLIDDGTVWNLQGSYGRTAIALLAAKLCTPRYPDPGANEGSKQWQRSN